MGDMITKYYRYVTKFVFPMISDTELRLLSTHLAQVKAAVFLHKAGKNGTNIKLRIWWLSDCFRTYLKIRTLFVHIILLHLNETSLY